MTTRLTTSVTYNGITVDFASGVLRDEGGRIVTLRRQTYDVLKHLAANAGHVVQKEDAMAAVWGAVAVTDDSLVQCVTEIRKAFRDHGHRLVRTVPKSGYMFVLPESRDAAPPTKGHWSLGAIATCLAFAGVVGLLWQLHSWQADEDGKGRVARDTWAARQSRRGGRSRF